MNRTLTERIQREGYAQETALSSLVINTPNIFDNATTAPTISKVHTLPFGLRLTFTAIINYALKFSICSVITLIIFCFILSSILLPINLENGKLLASSKTLTNQQYILLAKAQKASTYERLFKKADTYAFNDAKEIIHVNNLNIAYKPKLQKSNTHYSIQFSGY